MEFTLVCGLSLLLGIIPGLIAENKGHSFFGWWLFGALFFPIALIAALLISRAEPQSQGTTGQQGTQTVEPGRLDHRVCPYCAERVKREAIVCRYCNRDLPADDSVLGQMSPEARQALTAPQKDVIEKLGYLLPPQEANRVSHLLRYDKQPDEVTELITTKGTPVDGRGYADPEDDAAASEDEGDE